VEGKLIATPTGRTFKHGDRGLHESEGSGGECEPHVESGVIKVGGWPPAE